MVIYKCDRFLKCQKHAKKGGTRYEIINMKKRLLIMICVVLLFPVLLVSVSAAVIDEIVPNATTASTYSYACSSSYSSMEARGTITIDNICHGGQHYYRMRVRGSCVLTLNPSADGYYVYSYDTYEPYFSNMSVTRLAQLFNTNYKVINSEHICESRCMRDTCTKEMAGNYAGYHVSGHYSA